MTEHSAGIFVFFFLAEYASIILMCILISIVLLGGYEIFTLFYYIEKLFLLLIYIILSIEDILFIILSLIGITSIYIINVVYNISLYNDNIDYLYKIMYFYTNNIPHNYNEMQGYSFIKPYIISITNNNIIFSIINSITLAIKSFSLVFLFI
jgi:hypothetical protein